MDAGFLLRLKAFLIDYLLILGYGILLLTINMLIFPQLQNLFADSLWLAQLSGFIMVTLPVSVYFIASDSLFGGQSYGKKKMGIQTVTEEGAAVSVRRAFLRTLLKFLPWELSHFLVYRLVALEEQHFPLTYTLLGGFIYALIFLYILTAIFTGRKQSFYDLAVKTRVLKIER